MFAWQATKAESAAPLAGDDLLPETKSSSTHAISIRAPRDAIWPWLAQMGCDRAGWYSYDRLDNGGRPSATTIRPEWQEIEVGQILPSRPGRSDGFEVLRAEAPELLLLGAFFRLPAVHGLAWDSDSPRAHLRSTWGFYLQAIEGGTRLVVRARAVFRPRWVGSVVNVAAGPAHVAMQRRQLLNIQARAESL